MKNYLRFLSIGLLGAITLASCSQSKDLTSTPQKEDPSRRYYKEYRGNKIVYHDQQEEEAKEETSAATEEPAKAETSKEVVTAPSPVTGLTENSMSDKPSSSESLIEMKEKNEGNSKGKMMAFLESLKQNRDDVMSGKAFTKEYYAVDAKGSGDQTTSVGANEIFALLGLIFGASSFVMGIPGLIFGVIGIVFGLIGMNATDFWRIFGLVGFILGIIGAVISFIFILA